MTEIVGVRFKGAGKVYYFDPNGQRYEKGLPVIVETAQGTECAEVSIANTSVEDDKIVSPLKKVLRPASDDDLRRMEENRQKEQKAFDICNKKIAEHKLEMKLTGVEYAFDGSKILFYFTADGRVDFRELVKDLASQFHTRIELRQIGVRDEAKMLGGIGICGQPFCCSRFLADFQPVSIKMAKEQGLSPNPLKISGSCGRLMCCLKYEQHAYECLLKETPKHGASVQTPDGTGVVTDVALLKGTVKVKFENENETTFRVYDKADVRPLVKKDGGSSQEPVKKGSKAAGGRQKRKEHRDKP